jgi:hypothetical protein
MNDQQARRVAHEVIAACATGDLDGLRAALVTLDSALDEGSDPSDVYRVAGHLGSLAGSLARSAAQRLDEPVDEVVAVLRAGDPYLED